MTSQCPWSRSPSRESHVAEIKMVTRLPSLLELGVLFQVHVALEEIVLLAGSWWGLLLALRGGSQVLTMWPLHLQSQQWRASHTCKIHPLKL